MYRTVALGRITMVISGAGVVDLEEDQGRSDDGSGGRGAARVKPMNG
jgi:hypothetical protein